MERQKDLIKRVKENVTRAQAKQKKYYDKRHQLIQYQVGDIVWVRTHPLSNAEEGFMAKLSPKWKGPAKIVKRLGPVNYKVLLMSDPSNLDTYHIQNLKICHGEQILH